MKKTVLLFFSFFVSCESYGQNFEGSGDCQDQLNINNSNWNIGLANMKDAVFLVKIPFKDVNNNLIYPSFCTGNLINQNISQNSMRQLFAIARHCLHDGDPDRKLVTSSEKINEQWVFFFNYQSPGSLNSEVPDDNNINGPNRNAVRYSFASNVNIIDETVLGDFALVEIVTPIPPHYNVYYQGWSVSPFQGLQLPNYVIHHPSKDIKKWAKAIKVVSLDNEVCHVITEVVDVVVHALFGTDIRSRRICNYLESPFYTVQRFTEGVVEHGSSGSGLLNINQKLIGVLSGLWGTCDIPRMEPFGKLRTAVIQSHAIKIALEPNNFFAVNCSGRRRTCEFDLLNLNGEYYPAKDYQPENKIVLRAKNRITTAPLLNIRQAADYEFVAGNSIKLSSGFGVRADANFRARIGNDCAAFTGNREAVEEVAGKPKFVIGGLKKGYLIEKSVYLELQPNPSYGKVQLKFAAPKTQNDVSLQLISSDGKVVYTQKWSDVLSLDSNLDFPSLSNGVYTVRLRGDEFVVTKKLVISR